MFALLAFGSAAFMISTKFKYNQPITIIDKINSSFVNTPPNINNKYNWQKSNPNVYGNLVAYAAPVHSRVKPIVKRSRSSIMIIDEGLSPFFKRSRVQEIKRKTKREWDIQNENQFRIMCIILILELHPWTW